MMREKGNGRTLNIRMPKSVIKILVKIGWSIRPLRIFLNITIQTSALIK
jgi:hypothetical protein